MDAIDSVVDPLREFAKDSVRLVKRCHKTRSKRIHEGGDSYCNRIRGYGICWVLREVDFYPINNIIVGAS
ncbi:hypothetical protein NC653_029599 [Populus alba x Populus x berolinensis]|uniref:Uncharacterized protein n=1 Tax=Populus alba x Populus x berolinensis TaxID=444605 RepID=A0AAD6M2Y9_9ROSI|nr:hypothetical protein NC653_029599 [Populus alba x Populus x berolinensis]